MLFANCIPVIGAINAIICDLQNSAYYPIPKDLAELLKKDSGKNVKWFQINYSKEDYQVIIENFDFLTEHGLGFYTKDKDSFPRLSNFWGDPSLINNAIIDTGKKPSHDYKKILNELVATGCRHLQLRFFKAIDLKELSSILKLIPKTSFRSIELVLSDFKESISSIESFVSNYPQVILIIVANRNAKEQYNFQETRVLITDEKIIDHTSCGKVSKEYFSINTSSFIENKRFNSCLNKKVGIDLNGKVKNCPSCEKCFGNANEIDLSETVMKQEFQKLWSVNKDQVAVCKDCEFRYICPDCRAFTEEDHLYGKPLKCGYDPYKGSWD